MKTRAFALMIVACMILGCDSSTDEQVSENAREDSPGEAYPRMTWKTLSSEGLEVIDSASPIAMTDKGMKLVEDKFRELDWDSPDSNPTFSFELDSDQSLTIIASSNGPGLETEMVAIWRRPGSETSLNVRRSKPLTDRNQAIALLNSFCKQDGKMQSLVEWLGE